VPNSRQLPIYRHNRARIWIGCGTHQSDVTDAERGGGRQPNFRTRNPVLAPL